MTPTEHLQKQVNLLRTRLEQVEYERDEWKRLAEAIDKAPDAKIVLFAAIDMGLTRTESATLQSLWGRGYRLSDVGRDRVRAAADRLQARAA